MKRILCLLLFAILLFAPQCFTAAQPSCSARGAVVMEALSEQTLYEHNADLPLPEASTTKIMTALLVLESVSPEEKFHVSARAASVEGSQLGLKAGEELSVRDLLYILMMKSGNDAAVVLAEGVSGSEEKFVERMNEKAAELGLFQTYFKNPHGLPAEGHQTTARELAKLTAEALEKESFRTLVSTQTAHLEYKDMVLTNSNKLLYTCQGVFGVKTGFTKKAGRCLVSAAERNGVVLICVTLNDGNDWEDHINLYDVCFPRVSRRSAVDQGAYHGTVPVLGGEGNAVLRNTLPLTTLYIDETPIQTTLSSKTVPLVFAPVGDNRTLGYLALISATGREVDRAPLNTVTRVEQKKEERTFGGTFLLKLQKLWRTFTSKTAF